MENKFLAQGHSENWWQNWDSNPDPKAMISIVRTIRFSSADCYVSMFPLKSQLSPATQSSTYNFTLYHSSCSGQSLDPKSHPGGHPWKE